MTASLCLFRCAVFYFISLFFTSFILSVVERTFIPSVSSKGLNFFCRVATAYQSVLPTFLKQQRLLCNSFPQCIQDKEPLLSGRQIFHTVINPLVSLRNAHFIFKCIFYAKIHFLLCKLYVFCLSQKHQCMISSRFIYVTFKTAFNIRSFADQICKNFYQQVLRIVEIFIYPFMYSVSLSP